MHQSADKEGGRECLALTLMVKKNMYLFFSPSIYSNSDVRWFKKRRKKKHIWSEKCKASALKASATSENA